MQPDAIGSIVGGAASVAFAVWFARYAIMILIPKMQDDFRQAITEQAKYHREEMDICWAEQRRVAEDRKLETKEWTGVLHEISRETGKQTVAIDKLTTIIDKQTTTIDKQTTVIDRQMTELQRLKNEEGKET